MRNPLWQRTDRLARNLSPAGLALVLVIIGTVPLHIPGYARVAPMLPLMAIYHWTLFRPGTMPAALVFCIGLLQDALTGLPIGINAVVYLGAYGIILSQRKFFVGKSFVMEWLGFAMVSGGASFATWALISVYYGAIAEPSAVAFQAVVTIAVFPFVAWIFLRWQQVFLRYE